MELDFQPALSSHEILARNHSPSPEQTPIEGPHRPAFLEFFAGSGLVAEALSPYFRATWANDISPKKAAVYIANHGAKHFHLGPIEQVNPKQLPESALAWASFPCQDLSLAGANAGINGNRSGLVWEWLRIMGEMTTPPPVLVAENVTGLVSSKKGEHYRNLHRAIRMAGYVAGAVILDAALWVPQSRPRVFIIAVREDLKIPPPLVSAKPSWAHPSALIAAAQGLDDWVWWRIPKPAPRRRTLDDIVEWNADCLTGARATRNLELIPKRHRAQLMENEVRVAAGYKRIRPHGQVLELRFDGIAGCLRTPEGGSSRQFLVLKQDGKTKIRLLTARETARLMGAPETYKLPGSYNDGYKAMGDAVAVPVARHLARQILSPLSRLAQ